MDNALEVRIYPGGRTASRLNLETTDVETQVSRDGEVELRFGIASKGGGTTDLSVDISPAALANLLQRFLTSVTDPDSLNLLIGAFASGLHALTASSQQRVAALATELAQTEQHFEGELEKTEQDFEDEQKNRSAQIAKAVELLETLQPDAAGASDRPTHEIIDRAIDTLWSAL